MIEENEIPLDPDERVWEYSGEGVKVWKGTNVPWKPFLSNGSLPDQCPICGMIPITSGYNCDRDDCALKWRKWNVE